MCDMTKFQVTEQTVKASPAWETVLDLDALGKAEGENWVWGGATCHGPAYRRCQGMLPRHRSRSPRGGLAGPAAGPWRRRRRC